MKRATATIVCAAVLISVNGCASMMHGSEQSIGISSSPSGANIAVDKTPAGTTPVVVKMKRGANHYVEITKDGYQPFQTIVTHSVSGAIAGNILFGGLIGLAVDFSSGAAYKLTPASIDAVLVKIDLPPGAVNETIASAIPVRVIGIAATAQFIYPVRITNPNGGWVRTEELFAGETGQIALSVNATKGVAVNRVSAAVIGSHEGLEIGASPQIDLLSPGKIERVRIPVTSDGTLGDGTTTIRIIVFGTEATGPVRELHVASDTVTVDIKTRAGRASTSVTR